MGCGGSTAVEPQPHRQPQQPQPQPHRQPKSPPPQHNINNNEPQGPPPPSYQEAAQAQPMPKTTPPLTMADIQHHNMESRGLTQWHPWRGAVYDVLALYRHFKPRIEEQTVERDPRRVFLSLSRCRVKGAERDHALTQFYIAPFKRPSELEAHAQKKADVELVRLIFSPEFEENPPNWQPGPDEIQIRGICDRELAVIERGAQSMRRDPNEDYFRLPHGVDAEDLRAWLEDWEKFDTEVPEEGWWARELEDEERKDAHDTFAASVRQWMEDWECFDMDIVGEAGWHVIEQNLVKNDVTTDDQEDIWEKRAQRSDLDDLERMKRKHKALADYFIQKYEWSQDRLDPYLLWEQLLRDNAKQLQILCDTQI